MVTGSFPALKRLDRGVDHPPPTSADVRERVERYFSPFGPSWPALGQTLPLGLPFSLADIKINTGFLMIFRLGISQNIL